MLREQCIPESKQFDVVLLVDASTSMGGDGGDGSGRSKLQAAVDAARVLLDELRLGPSSAATLDRAGIIAFHARVDLRQGLTQDRVALQVALSSITLAPGSQLDLGLEGATDELLGPRRRLGADRVIVVLTDGRATGGPEAALVRAEVAKARGITIFTVGLGADLDRDALVGIASRPELCTLLPNAAELSSVFQAIGRDLPCPKWDYWGRR